MTTVVVFWLIFALIGWLVGWQCKTFIHNVRIGRSEHKQAISEANEARSVNLYKTMENALKAIDDSVETLNPGHPIECVCAYCEIKFGPIENRVAQAAVKADVSVVDEKAGEVFHPEYIRNVVAKNKSLRQENARLQQEMKKRDQQDALEHQKNQKPVVVNTATDKQAAMAELDR